MQVLQATSDAANNPQQVKQFAGTMVALTDPENWNTTVYMPTTRELSAGMRALLLRWCALQGG